MGSKGVSQSKPKKSNPRFAAEVNDYSFTCPGESSPGQLVMKNNGLLLIETVRMMSLVYPLVY
jgi:hypothetical protein